MKLYLAGPMTGYSDFNYPTFNRYADLLREKGHVVFNPAEAHEGQTDLPLVEYYRADLPEVMNADAIAVLPGWRDSKGARLEVELTRHIGRTVYDAVLLASSDYDEADAVIEEIDELTPRPHVAIPGETGYQHPEHPPSQNPTSELLLEVGLDEPFPEGFATSDEFDPDALHPRDAWTGEKFEFYESNPERHTSIHGGVKDNVNKPRLDLIPSLPLFRAGEVLAFGARKYKPHNWRLGLSWLETFGSLDRHLHAWLDGEDDDPESGYHHLAHAVCQMLFLAEFVFRGTGEDDRFVTIDRDAVRTS